MRLYEIENPNTTLLHDHIGAVKIAVKKFHKGVAIYRGNSNYSDNNIIYRNPLYSSDLRTSRNTDNYYTLWVDNSDKWLDFPKRSKSLICTTSKNTAEGYGAVCVIVPLIDCKIGICPSDDFWFSFEKNVSNLHIMNSFISKILNDQLGIKIDSKKLNYKDLCNILNDIDKDKIIIDARFPQFNRIVKLAKTVGLVKMLDIILDPYDNNFKLTTWKKFDIKMNHEVWLSAPCLLIPYNIFENISKEIL